MKKNEKNNDILAKVGLVISFISLVVSIITIYYTKEIERGSRVAETYAEAIVSLEKLSFYHYIGNETDDFSLDFLDDKKIDDQFLFEYWEHCVDIKATLDVLGKEEYADKYWKIISSATSGEFVYDGNKVEELIELFREDLN